MKKCRYCGSELGENALYCSKCLVPIALPQRQRRPSTLSLFLGVSLIFGSPCAWVIAGQIRSHLAKEPVSQTIVHAASLSATKAVDEAQALIRLLLAKIAELEARIEALERQGKGKTPQNSSLPPSTQHPHARPQPPKRKSKKKRGGQFGHEKHERPLIRSDQCHDVQPLKPTECRRCGAKLSGSDPEPLRHQVWEVPEIKARVTAYQRHRRPCGHRRRRWLPNCPRRSS